MEAENSDSTAPAREPEQASLGDDEMAAGGASKFLTNLPSRGLFSSAVLSSNLVLIFPKAPGLTLPLPCSSSTSFLLN
ncbi:hypothetical protein KFK09_012030 [Dendrobium nobile]|uniref:Uncharacterized protein n=1 Tax=Dendrobium nobile TaxID=94219 RepID=A0A8T3BGH7_DENNO|nr:hypothetical protein KFK09_012030 [Dendrobium nobile]